VLQFASLVALHQKGDCGVTRQTYQKTIGRRSRIGVEEQGLLWLGLEGHQ